MAKLRIRWSGIARVVAIAAVGLIVMRLLPGLLRAPEPPPLAADVGLPKVATGTDVPRAAIEPRKIERRQPTPARRSHPGPTEDEPAAEATIGSRHRERIGKPRPRVHPEVVESTPSPVPEYVPPAPPESIPEAPPEPSPAPPSAPGDGSEEFAPH